MYISMLITIFLMYSHFKCKVNFFITSISVEIHAMYYFYALQNKDGGFLVRDSSKAGKYTVSVFSRVGGWVFGALTESSGNEQSTAKKQNMQLKQH